ncbi:Several near identical copies of this gene are pr_ [Arabidopsis thaliana]|uniref:Several near identical copies of this gene are pr> n=1 Tax=Arabidopsis thaliana TaxID=3702 RepID=Q9MAQ4_ARATH|nr:Several near identical copies of this gene are pr> [Arabidopsis thaliana]
MEKRRYLCQDCSMLLILRCTQPNRGGKEAFSVLSNSILRMDEKTWAKEKYDLRGFGLALTIWVLSAVPAFGAAYGVKDNEFQSEYPLILKWKSTTTPEFFKIVNLVNDVSEIEVNTIIGNPEDFKSLVPDFHTDDIEFQKVLELVKMAYRLKKTEWNTRCVDVCAALEEVGQNKINNKISDSEKLDRILTILEDLNKRVELIERILDIRMEEKNNQRSEEDEERKQEHEEVERQLEAEEEGGLERKAENDNESFEDSIREPNTQYGSYPGDDENTQRDDKSPTPRSSTPSFNILSEESLDVQKDKKRVSRGRNENKRVKPSVHAEDNLKTRKQVPRKRQKQVDSADVDVPTRKEAQSKKRKIIGNDGDNADNDGDNDDFQPAPQRKSKRGTVPSIHTQAHFTAEKKKHPILHPFAKVDATRLEKLAEWKKSRKNKPLSIAGNIVDTKWFTILVKLHVDAALELMKTRKESNPELFKNKLVVFVGSSFLNVIDESYMEFLDNKEGFQFQSEEIKEVKKKYVVAYSIAMPYIVQNILKKEDMDVSPFSIKVLTTFPQAPRNEESGIYMLKFMECYSMYTSHSNFEGNIIQNVRNKLVADIFTELESVTL